MNHVLGMGNVILVAKGFFRDGVVQPVRGMDAEFCTTNGFADFCRNKSQACGRQWQVDLALLSFSEQELKAMRELS